MELARFRRHETLRIMLRDVLAIAPLPEITAELTTLADVIVDVAYDRIHDELVERYGEPITEADKNFSFRRDCAGQDGGGRVEL